MNTITRSKASDSFGKRNIGRRFVLTTGFSKNEVDRIIELNKELGIRHYSIFSKKIDTTFNCATYVRRLVLESTGLDLDCNGGKIVYPNDIIGHQLFDSPGRRIRF